ncbi:MAG: cytochrome c biogenesis protein CcsA [Fimbriimonas sp.]
MNELLPPDLVSPPDWSLAVGSACSALVIVGTLLFGLSALAWFFAPRVPVLSKVGGWAFTLGSASLLVTFAGLASLFVNNRYEFSYVYGHADSKNAIPYRIAGIWSGQEGSFLLWACCAAIFGLLTVRLTQQYRRWFTIAYAVFLGGITNILAFESPFRLNLFEGKPFVPAEGVGLAPSLQNYWVIIHPPTIFLGFGALTVLFAMAFAALMERDYDEWLPIVRPWALVTTAVLGLGLCMGGFWAYETLGWGGFWMWDPVENVSFVPWCFTIAFIHGIYVQAARKTWKMANVLLGGIPFIAFVYGTFMTRSGLLSDTSVHSFAEMDRSALKLLVGVMGITTLGFFTAWGIRLAQFRKEPARTDEGTGLRREAFYLAGVMTVILIGLAAMIGMSVPLFMALSGQKPKVVEEGLYHQVLPYLFVPLMLLMAITPFVSWRKMDPKAFWSRAYSIFCISVGLTGITLFLLVMTPVGKVFELQPTLNMFGNRPMKALWWMMVMVGLCYTVLVANVWRIRELVQKTRMGTAPFIAHIGLAMLMAGLICSRGFQQHGRTMVMEDHPGKVLGYDVQFKGLTSVLTDRNNQAKFDVFDSGSKKLLFTAYPGLYDVKQGDQVNVMVWPFIQRGWFHDVYFALGAPQDQTTEDVNLAVGKSMTIGGLILTYEKMVRTGQPGMAGTKFGAQVRVKGSGPDRVVTPQMEIAQGVTVDHPADLGDNMSLQLAGMNAADQSVTVRVKLNSPVYPVEVFHKPLVGLVWLGTAVMTFGGFLSAVYRRNKPKGGVSPVENAERNTQPQELVHTK